MTLACVRRPTCEARSAARKATPMTYTPAWKYRTTWRGSIPSTVISAVGTPPSAAAVTVTSTGSGCADSNSRSNRRCSLTSLPTGKADCRRIASRVSRCSVLTEDLPLVGWFDSGRPGSRTRTGRRDPHAVAPRGDARQVAGVRRARAARGGHGDGRGIDLLRLATAPRQQDDGHDGGGGAHDGGDRERAGEAVRQRRGQSRSALQRARDPRRRDGRQDGRAQRRADLLGRVEQTRVEAGVLGRAPARRGDRYRYEGHAEPDADDDHRGHYLAGVVAVGVKAREEHEARRRDEQPDDEHRLGREAVDHAR